VAGSAGAMVRQPRAGVDLRERRGALTTALVAAAALHVAVLGSSYLCHGRRAEPAVLPGERPAIDVELELVEKVDQSAAATATAEPTHAETTGEPLAPSTSHHAPTSAAGEEAALATPPAESAAPGASAEAPPSSPAPAADARRPIDLGLEGGYMRMALMSGQFEKPEAPPKASVGLLSEGLASLDAAHGTSRSSAVVHAGYEAARELAPSEGLALFDVRADATGAVVSVALVSSGPDEQRWTRVGARLRDLLSGRRLRVAPGTRGLVTRVRIEHGAVAKTRTELEQILGRGPAMGQGEGPPRAIAEESTHQSFALAHRGAAAERSEERRVGKECRSRWSPYH